MRHARLLRELGLSVAVVSRRQLELDHGRAYVDLGQALAVERPDYVVVANETSRHFDTIAALAEAGFDGTVLVEKPLFDSWKDMPRHRFKQLLVGYNLRFHPLLRALSKRLSDEEPISAELYVGQHLPDWRPGSDYGDSYSAHADLGGGALRDLSHEIDYVTWLFGPWLRVAALGGRYGNLRIDSDDCWAILMTLEKCPMATIHLNYLDRVSRRRIVVNTDRHTYSADFIAGQLDCDGRVEAFSIERDASYLEQHRLALDDSFEGHCGESAGLAGLEAIEAIEKSARDGVWIER